jgi:hypothetical protein
MSLNLAENNILERWRRNPESRSARALASALRISTTRITKSARSQSLGSDSIFTRFGTQVSLETLNEYRVILSKPEGCDLLTAYGVRGLSDKRNFLNRHIDETEYNTHFDRSVCKCRGRGNKKIVLTYGEIIYIYTEVLGRQIPDLDLIIFPTTLRELADEGDLLFP